MNECRDCGNENNSTLIIFTETTFGHGDSTHKCYAKCTVCGNTSKNETDWGLFSDKTFRAAQGNWNKENPTT